MMGWKAPGIEKSRKKNLDRMERIEWMKEE